MTDVEAARAPGNQKDILTTLYYPRRAAWVERADLIDRESLSRRAIFRRLVAESDRYRTYVLNGAVGRHGAYVDLAAAGIVSRRADPPLVVLSECAWKRKSGAERLLRRASIAAIDNPRIVYCVLSTAETRDMPRMWGIDPERVVFTAYCHNLTDEELASPPPEDDGSVFAGGNALRDYGPVLAAARELRGAQFTILTDNPLPPEGGELPSNVDHRPAAGGGFVERMRKARIVVVPFRAGMERVAGLLTYLSAMALGKVVVVTEAPGAHDYVETGKTGFVIPAGDARAMTERLRWALDPQNDAELREIAANAREAGRTRFHPDRYTDALLEVVDRFR